MTRSATQSRKRRCPQVPYDLLTMELGKRPPVRSFTPERVPDLVAEVFDPSRILPLVLVTTSPSHGDKPLLDPAELGEQLEGRADVAVLADQAASWALGAALPEKWSTYGGALRIFWADATERDPVERHPRVYVNSANTTDTVRHVVSRIRGSVTIWTSDTATAALSNPSSRPDTTRRAEDADLLREHLRAARQDLAAARKDNRALQSRIRDLKSSEASAATLALPPAVFTDPEAQFRYETEQIWLWRYPEAERTTWPLRPYQLGPDWLTSLGEVTQTHRRDILDVVTDVLTGRAVDVPGRQVRAHKTHASGGAPQLVRGDGAAAWRCNIKNNSPAAPRLTWWKLRSGTLELGRLSLHDDTKLR
ncbi:hypothetical protein ACH41H_25015 [Streptomyces sp. NPDC020800]|uniref:hypothetical protein n=1 Tax=Streptomyces sp. NPDC020800 TaxID=3365092 RepID=UPI0037B32A30